MSLEENESTPLLVSAPSSEEQYGIIETNAVDDMSEYEYSEDEEEDDDDEDDDDGSYLKKEIQKIPWKDRPSFNVLLVAITLYLIGVMCSQSSLLDVIVYLVCQDYYKTTDPSLAHFGNSTSSLNLLNGAPKFNDPLCSVPKVTTVVGTFSTRINTITFVLELISVPLLSSYADRWGRKPIMIAFGICTLISSLISMSVAFRPDFFNYKILYVGGIVDGLCGLTVMTVMSTSYVSDIVKETNRAQLLSILDAAFSAAMALGPALGSLILSFTNNNILNLFVISFVISAIFFALVVFLLPESRSEKDRNISIAEHAARKSVFLESQKLRRASYSSTSSFATTRLNLHERARELLHNVNFIEPLKVLKFPNVKTKRARVNVYLLIASKSILYGAVFNGVPFLLLLAKTKFNWATFENNLLISLMGSSKFIVLSYIFPRILGYLRNLWLHNPRDVDQSDKVVLIGSLIFSSTGYLAFAEAPTGSIFMLAAVLFSFGAGVNSVMQNTLIKYSPRGKVAEVLGGTQTIINILSIFLPTVFALIYEHTAETRPQAIGELLFVCDLFVCFILMFLYIESPTIDDVETMVFSHDE